MNAYVKPAAASMLEGSEGDVSDRLIESPSFTLFGALNVADGGTLSIVTDAV